MSTSEAAGNIPNKSGIFPRLILLMGVAGSGKTTVGKRLAETLGYRFLDADDFHTPEAIARMQGGVPLTAAVRDAWVDRLQLALLENYAAGTNCVMAFSGLRARHRRQLMNTGFMVSAFMLKGSEALLRQRIAQRADHFMPESQLPDQLERMEAPQPDEAIESIDVTAQPDDLVATLAARLT